VLVRSGFPHVYDVMVYVKDNNYFARDSKGDIICRDSNTACIQEAVDYVRSLGGGKVYIRRGVYRTHRYINIMGENVELFGDGMGRTVIENYSTLDPAIYIGWDNQTSIIAKNIYIHDITIDAKYQYDASNPRGNGNSTLWAYYASDLILERIEHKNAYWRTSITPGSIGCSGQCIQENVIIKENIFRGVALTLGGIRNLILENNIFYGSAISPVFNTMIDFSFGEYQDSYIFNASVKGNLFLNSRRHPAMTEWLSVIGGFIRVVSASFVGNTFIDPDRIAIYVQSATAPGTQLDVRGLSFIGNTIVGIPDRLFIGIRVERHQNVLIKGNYIEGTQIGITTEDNAEVIVEGNYIRETRSAALWISNSRAVINGNLMYNCARQSDKCIILDGTSQRSIVMGNRLFRDVSTYLPVGIDTQFSQGQNLILGNMFEGQWSATRIANHATDTVVHNIT